MFADTTQAEPSSRQPAVLWLVIAMSATIRPENALVLLIDPLRSRTRSFEKANRGRVIEKYRLLGNATDIARVPRWLATFNERSDEDWLLLPSANPQGCIFRCDEAKVPWHNEQLINALKLENRDRILFGGFWLDSGLGASALEACVDGFDVHVITDLTFSREPDNAANVMRRLEQHGVVPVTLYQVIYELMIWMSDKDQVREMSDLLGHEVFI